MTIPATIFEHSASRRAGEIEGKAFGSDVSVIVVDHQATGEGPALHRHPYPETFVVLEGAALFEIDGEHITVQAGEVVVAPAGSAHRFENAGPGRLLQVDIHSADAFDTEWLGL
jgi:mannose-6-phosphate isomerase-like protein (cupin superfamily)